MIQYNNGNSSITLFRDGTKIRIPIKQEFDKRFETVDLKITDYCDAGCSYCHENSTTDGREAKLNHLLTFVSNFLEPYTEIAIGGGDPLSHPNLTSFLLFCRDNKMICSITVNSFHITESIVDLLNIYLDNGLLNNIGISYNKNFAEAKKLLDERINRNKIVYHLIYGVNDIPELVELYNLKRVLVLGYKFHGRGAKGKGLKIVKELPNNKSLNEFIKNKNIRWCFDTLAVEQLELDKNSIFYMGDEGEHSLYVDMVKKEFCKSSYSEKRENLVSFVMNTPLEFYNIFDKCKKLGDI